MQFLYVLGMIQDPTLSIYSLIFVNYYWAKLNPPPQTKQKANQQTRESTTTTTTTKHPPKKHLWRHITTEFFSSTSIPTPHK